MRMVAQEGLMIEYGIKYTIKAVAGKVSAFMVMIIGFKIFSFA